MRFIDKAYIIHHMPFFTVIAWTIVCSLSYILYPSGNDRVALVRVSISLLIALPLAFMLCVYNVYNSIKKYYTTKPEKKLRREAFCLLVMLYNTPSATLCWDDLVDLANHMNEKGYDFLESMNALVMSIYAIYPSDKVLPEAIMWRHDNKESYDKFAKRAS